MVRSPSGQYTITASSSGYLPASAEMFVTDEARITVPFSLTVAVGGTVDLPVFLPGPAPAGGVTVTLTSVDTTKLIMTSTIIVPQGLTTPVVQPRITGVAPGWAWINVAAIGYTSVQRPVWVTP